MRRFFLASLGMLMVAMVLFRLENPMLLIFPLWIFSVLLRDPLSRFFGRFRGGWGFFIAGVIYGMLIEGFAIINNLSLPPEARVLLHPDPLKDLFYGVFYYAFVAGAWSLLLRKWRYTLTQVFLLTGVYGVFVEETGQVLLRIFSQGLSGVLYALLVLIVYGLFPMLALMVGEGSLPQKRTPAGWKAWLLALLALFLQYAIYGNTIYPWFGRLLAG